MVVVRRGRVSGNTQVILCRARVGSIADRWPATFVYSGGYNNMYTVRVYRTYTHKDRRNYSDLLYYTSVCMNVFQNERDDIIQVYIK